MQVAVGGDVDLHEQRLKSGGRSGWDLLLGFVFAILLAGDLGGAAYWAYQRYWPRELHVAVAGATPRPVMDGNGLRILSPTGNLVAIVGEFDDELTAYLNFEYLRSLNQIDSQQVLLTAAERSDGPQYRLYLSLPDDVLTAVPFLANLEAERYIPHFELSYPASLPVEDARKQTNIFLAAYSRPVKSKLETIDPAKLKANVSTFILFKAKTDRRTREQLQPVLSSEQAGELAADVLAVSKFYAVPLEFFLGVGAMENNFLNVRGDLEHTVWKRRAEPGDIVLKRRHHRVLVRNYSVGVWQITRETLRYAHQLYLADTRDYSQLPERLRPSRSLDLNQVDSHVLTAYAGLLLRNLLDQFNGDVAKAIGAYNGGPRNPNDQYAQGVSLVAEYARNVLQQAALVNGRAVADSTLVLRKQTRAPVHLSDQNSPSAGTDSQATVTPAHPTGG